MVVVDNCEMKGYLVNESISGASIAGVDFLMLPYGQPMEIKYRDEAFYANIRNAARDDKDNVLVGLSRADALGELPDPEDAMVLNCFVQVKQQSIVCIPVAMKNERMVRVQLFDGMQFDVQRKSLLSFTRVERFEQLAHEESLNFVAEMYGIGASLNHTAKKRLVFEFEFGKLANCPTKQLAGSY